MSDAPTTTRRSKEIDKGTPEDRLNAVLDEAKMLMVEAGMDEQTAEAKLFGARPNAPDNLVGNFADLQRMGGQLAPQEGGIADAFVVPEGAAPEVVE